MQPRPKLAVLLDLLLLQHAERLTWEVVAAEGVFGINAKRVAQFVARETVEMRLALLGFSY